MAFKKIAFTHNYFISEAGYVYVIENGKERILKVHCTKTSANPFVWIDKKMYDLLYLMIEYFDIKIKPTDSIKYKKSPDNHIQLSSIKVKNVYGDNKITDLDAKELIYYKCEERARNANIRCEENISAIEVYNVIKTHNYSCVYCNTSLKHSHWHLDHFYAISKGGKNIFENLVSSCSRCNIMKGSMDGYQFISLCKRIANKTLIKQNL